MTDRRAQIIAQLYPQGDSTLAAHRLAHVCASVTQATGAGLMLMSGDTPRR